MGTPLAPPDLGGCRTGTGTAIPNTLSTCIATSRSYGKHRQVTAPGEWAHSEPRVGRQSATEEQGIFRINGVTRENAGRAEWRKPGEQMGRTVSSSSGPG